MCVYINIYINKDFIIKSAISIDSYSRPLYPSCRHVSRGIPTVVDLGLACTEAPDRLPTLRLSDTHCLDKHS